MSPFGYKDRLDVKAVNKPKEVFFRIISGDLGPDPFKVINIGLFLRSSLREEARFVISSKEEASLLKSHCLICRPLNASRPSPSTHFSVSCPSRPFISIFIFPVITIYRKTRF